MDVVITAAGALFAFYALLTAANSYRKTGSFRSFKWKLIIGVILAIIGYFISPIFNV